MPVVVVEISGVRTVLDGRVAQIVQEVLRCADRIRDVPVGGITFRFDGKASVHPPVIDTVLSELIRPTVGSVSTSTTG